MNDGSENAGESEPPDMDPERYDDAFGEGEWERLQANPVTRFEYENTIDALASYLPEQGHVLDAGGGPGRYSIWLAEHGYTVDHLDVTTEQVRLAREKVDEHGVGDRVSCRQGGIRDLPFDDARFDAVCCLGGPLSHVLDADAREDAVRELRRVATPGAPVFVSVIGRLTALRDGIKHGLDDHPETLPQIAETGDHTEALIEEHGSDGWAECGFGPQKVAKRYNDSNDQGESEFHNGGIYLIDGEKISFAHGGVLPEKYGFGHTATIQFGREYCTARKPACLDGPDACSLFDLCDRVGVDLESGTVVDPAETVSNDAD